MLQQPRSEAEAAATALFQTSLGEIRSWASHLRRLVSAVTERYPHLFHPQWPKKVLVPLRLPLFCRLWRVFPLRPHWPRWPYLTGCVRPVRGCLLAHCGHSALHHSGRYPWGMALLYGRQRLKLYRWTELSLSKEDTLFLQLKPYTG